MAFCSLVGAAGDILLRILKVNTTIYLCLIAAKRLSCTVSDIIKFFCQPEMDVMVFSPLGDAAVDLYLWIGF